MATPIRQTPIICNGHTRPVIDLSFAEDPDCGPLLISSSKDCKAMLRRGDTGDWIGSFIGHGGAVWSCSLNTPASLAATGSADFSAKIWSVYNGQEILSIPQSHIVRSVSLSRCDEGKYLLSANNKQQVLIYDLSDPAMPICKFSGHEKNIRKVLWINNDTCIATLSEDKIIRLFDVQCQDKEFCRIELPNIPTDAELWIRDDLTVDMLVAVGKTAQIFKFDFRSWSSSLVTTFNLPSTVCSAALNPNADMLVCGCEDNLIYQLDADSQTVLGKYFIAFFLYRDTCRGHFGPVHCVRFSPDGHLFASGSEDGTVRLWQSKVGEEYGLWRCEVPSDAPTIAPLPTASNEMSKEAPPIMRKLLIGQLANANYGSACLEEGVLIHSIPFPPNRQLLFSLIWLQGYVLGTSSSSSNSYFLLDDGTGSILVKIQSGTEPPSLGSYVSVVGEIVRDSTFIQSPFDDFSSSLKSLQLAARSVMCLSLADNHFSIDEDSFRKNAPPSAYAELSWPLEVIDMSRNFSAPA